MKNFYITQRTTDYYVVEAETEEEAFSLLHEGAIEVSNTKYEDYYVKDIEQLVRAV